MAAAKKTMTLNLTDAEMAVLEDLCAKKDLSKTGAEREQLGQDLSRTQELLAEAERELRETRTALQMRTEGAGVACYGITGRRGACVRRHRLGRALFDLRI